MDLYRIFTQLELLGNLLVLASGHCEQEDLPFERRQRVEALPQFGNNFSLSAALAASSDSCLHTGLVGNLTARIPFALTDTGLSP
jgi:hypothetical protein